LRAHCAAGAVRRQHGVSPRFRDGQVIQATLNRGLPAWQVRGDQLIIPWSGRIRVDYLDNRIGHSVALAALLDSADTPA
jgi:hypothetical protein